MSNFKTYLPAAACALLALATATPAAACVDVGYSGIFTFGWPYASRGVSNPQVYKYRSCGGIYNLQGWGECGGYGTCGWAPIPPVVVTVPVTDMPMNAPVRGGSVIIRRKARGHRALIDRTY